MKEIRLHIKSIEEMQSLAYDLTHLLKPTNVLALNGDLGAGKTTFTKGIGKALEIGRVINSPTFTIMKVYDANNKVNGIEKLYHLDVYRLDGSSDDFELEEYFYQNGITVVEWALIIEDILPNDTFYMDIYRLTEDTREVVLKNFTDEIISKLGEKYEVIHG